MEELKICPNPNTGSFEIQSNCPLQKEDVRIFDIFGNKLDFSFTNNKIHLQHINAGMLLVQINIRGKFVVKEIFVR
ncbi:MAG: T9SS type A sorting domain-containing protein [Chlorobi bacterium]|nr:T9SS type A sorting domain-containing protein [Chlorobiota bacterium]